MNSPFRNYDQWLTTDRMAEDADLAYEKLLDDWTEMVNEFNLPLGAEEPEHPEHAIFAKWKVFYEAALDYEQRMNAKAEAEMLSRPMRPEDTEDS